MANYATLKAAIQEVIKTNGNNEITGALLQQSLLAMVNSLGADYQFMGIATPSTNPGTPDQNVAYIAGAGTYPNFNNTTIQDGYLGVFKYKGSWTVQTVQVGKNYDSSINKLEYKIDEKFQVAYTRGLLQIAKDRTFTVTENLTCRVNHTSYTIPANSSFSLTNISASTTTLWAIIFDTANLQLIAKAWSSSNKNDIIICTVSAATSTTLSGVIHCVVPYTFDGKYFSAAQTTEIIASVGLEKLGQKYGVFYTRGVLEFSSARTVKNTENLICRIGTTSYTIPANTISDLSNISANVVFLWAIVFDTTNLILAAKPWNQTVQTDLIIATVTATSNTIGRIDHCVVPYTLDGADYSKDVVNLKKNRLVPVATQGYINCDNVNKKFITTKNIVIRFNNVTYTVPANTELSYSWSTANTSLYKLCVDVNASPLAFTIVRASVDTELPVLFTFYGFGTSTANNSVVQIITSVITTKIDGEDVDDRVEDVADRVTKLENETSPIRTQIYQGEHVIIDSNKFARKAIPIASSVGQSFAAYGDYLITCNYSDSTVTAKVMSLSNGTLLATLNLPYGSLHRPHCNVCCFGNEFGSENSIAPLLYVSQWDYEYQRGVLVYDFKLIDGVYSVELVQTIVPNNIGTQYLGAGCVDWVVDTDNSMLYALAYYVAGSSTIVEGNKEMICKFALPKLVDGANIELTETDILDNWEMEMFNFSQDKCYNSGKIFVLSGYDTYPQWTKIRVIDLLRKEIVSVIPLAQYGGEPEGMDVVQGFLTYGYSGSNIYRLFF